MSGRIALVIVIAALAAALVAALCSEPPAEYRRAVAFEVRP